MRKLVQVDKGGSMSVFRYPSYNYNKYLRDMVQEPPDRGHLTAGYQASLGQKRQDPDMFPNKQKPRKQDSRIWWGSVKPNS